MALARPGADRAGHGVPNWVDLHTGQPATARCFYQNLFGWTYHEGRSLAAVPADGTEPPRAHPGSIALLDGEPVAEIVGRSDTFTELGLVSTWFPYVRVADLDSVLRLVEPAGGLVLSAPAGRGTAARVATILDPSDALLCLWESLDCPGAVCGSAGAMRWIELETPELDLAAKFYGELFGWDVNETPPGPDCEHRGPYTVFTSAAEPVAGGIEVAKEGIPAAWCPSFAVADADGTAERAMDNGGVVLDEPSNIPIGRQVMIVDPTGAPFAAVGPIAPGPRPL